MEDEEYKKLPSEDKCVHKLWKARVAGYEEVTSLFKQLDDEKSPEFGKYLGLVKKFVVDSNALGQEKGLEATLAYVENYAHAGKTVSEVMSGVVAKCIAAPKAKTRELALQVTLMYIEIEKHEAVEEELIKGMELKNPKIVTACINACTIALREFGPKIINVKPLLKKISTLLSDRDKGVRDETKLMVIEMYRWIGTPLRVQLQTANLQAIQITELESEFSKFEGQKPTPTRYIRSQQVKQAKLAQEQAKSGDVNDELEEEDALPEIDPLELVPAVEILSKVPKDFYEKIEAKKWQERKEMLETVESLVKNPKLENGDYGDLVRACKKVIQKDSNVVCVALAGRVIAGLANGLKKKFQTYSGFCIPAILEKFKEKKQNVVTALREAGDAVYLTTNLEAILEDVIEALNNKNPSVKTETSLFLARSFTKTIPSAVNKKVLKAITAALTKNMNEPDPGVRDATAEALGTLMKLVGEKSMAPFLIDLEKDNLKIAKIKEYCDSAVIVAKSTGVKKERPVVTPKETKSASKPEPKKASAPIKKKPEISSGTATVVRSKSAKSIPKSSPFITEKELSDDEVDEIINNVLTSNIITDIFQANWKTRLEAADQILTLLKSMDSKLIPTQALIKFITKKPGLKDTNVQVLKSKIEIVKYLAENSKFSKASSDCCVADLTDKFSDAKNSVLIGETLSAIAEATALGPLADIVLESGFAQKSPKVQQEALNWLSGAIKDFGITNINVKLLIDYCKKGLGSTNPGVRQAAISLLGTMYLYMGGTLYMFFENEKSSLRDQIKSECDKYEGEKAPVPTRGVVKSASVNSLLNDDAEEGEEQVNIQDLMPRVDISNQITDSLLNELSDKSWKVRSEALPKLQTIINEAKFIKPNLGDLAQALPPRINDSNVKVAQNTLLLCESICKAMGPPFKQYIRVLFPSILQGLSDSKAAMRASCMETFNCFKDQCGYKEFFEGEMIADALKCGSPSLRIELWGWLAENLPKVPPKQIPREELMACLPHLYSNVEDRNADVRKNAQEAVLGYMIHLGFENMVKQTEKLKPGSKGGVLTVLEKAKPNLPIKPLPAKKVVEKEEKVVRGTKPVANAKNAVKKTATAKAAAASSGRKKDEDIDTSPLLVINNLKNQRNIDESKLKVLKWNFTQPREEFVELLKDQMNTANVNKTLMTNMFHIDFRYHIKALESLNDDLADNSEALMSNLDLILKWLTLRFFDTNPSVLLKGLEYLQFVFNMLIDSKYRLLEYEASSFIPYLINKIGDPKDSVRNGVKALLNQLTRLLPVNKLFTYVMDGVKSKNARQRAECLEVMGGIIEGFGMNVCVPSPGACLKEVAKQISDRDNSVRNAALNCVVQAYFIVGEKVYKLVGNISDKDMSLLEERIKRSSRKVISAKSDTNSTIITTAISPHKDNSLNRTIIKQDVAMVNEDEGNNDNYEDLEEDILPVNLPSQISIPSPPKEITGPFKLDPDFMQELERSRPPKPVKLKLKSYSLDFLHEEIRVPTIEEAAAQIKSGKTSHNINFTEAVARVSYGGNKQSPKKQDAVIERLIKQIGSQTTSIAIAGMTQLRDILDSPRAEAMADYEDEFMKAVITQFKNLQSADLTIDVFATKTYKNLFTTIDAFYANKTLGNKVSVPLLKELTHQMIDLLVQERLNKIQNGDAYVRVINLHCVKFIERSDHTNAICALVQLIIEYISSQKSDRHVDLVMKCLWRVIKLMPQWGDNIDFDLVLLEVHNFLKKFPSSWWKSKEIDTPLRTVKTILHSSAKIKGGAIMLHLGKIPNTSDSEVESYILRLLKSLKISEIQHIPVKQETQRRSLSRANHKMLTDIFQKIGSKDETKEGLNLLYDFMKQHSEADIEPFLANCSKFFQDYIRNGLKEIEDSRNKINETTKESVTDITVINVEASKGPDYWKERLNMWNNVWNNIVEGKEVAIPE